MSFTPPDPAPTVVSSELLASDEWPDRLRVLLGAALALAGPNDRDTVLQRIVESAASVAKARYAALGVYADTGELTTFVHHGFDESTVASIGHYPRGEGLLGQVIIADRPVRLDDLAEHPSSCGFPAGHPDMRTFLGVPILRAGQRHGNLYVTGKQHGAPFDETDEALIVALAAFAAGAIDTAERVVAERARAVAEEQARARRELLGQVIAAQEAERARVSRDLHDDVGQALTSVLLGLRLVEDSFAGTGVDSDEARRRIADLRELVADGLRRARQLAFDLRPTVLDDIGLEPALHRLRQDLAARSGLVVELDTAALHREERLSPGTETVVYRVVQEALTNVIRHAAATSASVTLSVIEDRVRVFIEDDGKGFDSTQPLAEPNLGTQGMQERAKLVDGSLSIMSEPGAGTVVLLEVPRG